MTSGMPEHEPVFSISVVARLVGLHQQTVRQYERAGLVLPARSQGNTRRYSQADIERLRQVIRMVDDLGVNLAGVQVALGLLQQIEELRVELDATRVVLTASEAEVGRVRTGMRELQTLAKRLQEEFLRTQGSRQRGQQELAED